MQTRDECSLGTHADLKRSKGRKARKTGSPTARRVAAGRLQLSCCCRWPHQRPLYHISEAAVEAAVFARRSRGRRT